MKKTDTAIFTQQLEMALKNFTKPDWLGANSPLATPAFLGSYLRGDGHVEITRGQALQRLLVAGTANITGKYADRYQTILREYYFQNRPATVVWDEVGLAKNSFHLSRRAAISALERALVTHVQPALRLEQPPFNHTLVERAELMSKCAEHLDALQTVAVVGEVGMGKSALAAQVVQTTERPRFWYTVRPGLNDRTTSFIFALALFAHRHGQSTLWLTLATNPGQTIDEQLLSSVRYVLTHIEPLPLLCIDGLERLQPATFAHHQAFVHCLEMLRGLLPILLVGRQLPLEADTYLRLQPLSAARVSQLLLTQLGTVSVSTRNEFYQLTRGNPRFIKLCLAALANGAMIEELHTFLSKSVALDQLFNHTVWHLPREARQLLMSLSVFPSPVALSHWQDAIVEATLTSLQHQGFLQLDQDGAAEVPPIYREFLLQQVDAATIRRLHIEAAQIRSRAGAHTAAAYHWVEANQPETALALWREFQVQEIAQGQAGAALTLFERVQRLDLSAAAHEQTTLICATLERILGQREQSVATLRSRLAKTPILAVESAELTGVIANDRSEFPAASAAFARGLQIAERLVEVRMARLYKGRAWMHLRQREIDQTERELSLAEFEVANMRGNLAMDSGRYAEAAQHYHKALESVEPMGLFDAIGKCTNNLAGVALMQGCYDDAKAYLARAVKAYERIGKLTAEAGCRITLAVAHNQAGEHSDALAVLEQAEALLTLQQVQQPWQQALLAQARAEAYLGLGEWKKAKVWAQRAIDAEEISVLPDSYRVYGELCTQQGAYDEAKQFLQQSRSLAEANEDQYLAAYAWRALARLYSAQGETEEAAAAMETAIALFEAMNLMHEVEQCR